MIHRFAVSGIEYPKNMFVPVVENRMSFGSPNCSCKYCKRTSLAGTGLYLIGIVRVPEQNRIWKFPCPGLRSVQTYSAFSCRNHFELNKIETLGNNILVSQ